MIAGGERRADLGRWDSNLVLLLSLQLLLLAFFILLVSLSKFETTRTHSAIDSVQRAFSSLVRQDEGERIAGLSDAEVLRQLQARIGRLAASLVPYTQLDDPGGGDRLTLRLPARALLRDGETAVTPAGRAFLRGLAGALRDVAPRLGFELTVLVDRTAVGAVGSSGALMRMLIDAGMPADRVAAGLGEAGAGGVEFTVAVAARPDAAPAEIEGETP
jgi:hypothetical protein